MFSYEFSFEPQNLQPQNRCFSRCQGGVSLALVRSGGLRLALVHSGGGLGLLIVLLHGGVLLQSALSCWVLGAVCESTALRGGLSDDVEVCQSSIAHVLLLLVHVGHLLLHIGTTSRSLDNAIRENTQRNTSKVLRLPCEMTMEVAKALPATKTGTHLLKTSRK